MMLIIIDKYYSQNFAVPLSALMGLSTVLIGFEKGQWQYVNTAFCDMAL
jgi:hypothetical protein